MKTLILTIALSAIVFSQDFQPTHKAMLDKIAFLESQLGQAYVEPNITEEVLVDIQYEIDNAAYWFYKTPRVECVAHIERMKAMVKVNELPQAIEVINMLIANQEKYFYKKYSRRPVTVARFEAIKTKLGG